MSGRVHRRAGSVQRLSLDGGLDSLNDRDKVRLDSILNDGKVWVPEIYKEKAEWRTPQGHIDRVRSEKVSADGYDLATAAQSARKARDDYSGTNYAAARCVGPDGQESILVAYRNKAGREDGKTTKKRHNVYVSNLRKSAQKMDQGG
ncbi:hypothetical protein OG304_32950 [Streptomyces sp. NBC_00160]|uniref:hypothetical protein n=1 Tax=Streptomyces sp. NBC_00160 TaxID=2903628 RepID=UPI00225B92E7|nr:hypothetical protein [Streptomyces sp. NBC_00160]MCX5308203.1 hypothetical protein [Streptomyces sp. NBC_00160]